VRLSPVFITAGVWIGAVSLVASPAPHPTGVQGGGKQAPSRDPAVVGNTVKQYCVTCHNTRTKTAGLALDSMDLADVPGAAEVWENVIRKLRSGAMPPAGLPRPDDATYSAVASWLEGTLDSASAARPNPGAPLLHRLNRAEYSNAIRDLLDLEVDASSLLPPDDASGGFDNNADLLGVSPVLLERYLTAAAKISAAAVGDPAIGATSAIYRVPGDASQTDHVEGLPLGTRGGVVARHRFPLDAEYVINVKLLETNLGAIRGLREPHQLEFTVDGARVFLNTVGGEAEYVASTRNATDVVMALDTRLTARIAVKAGTRVVGAAFLQRTSAQGGTRLEPFLRTTLEAMDHTGLPHVASMTITGPFSPTGPGDTPSRQRVFTCRPAITADQLPCATKIISTLARRGYRRPATDPELQRLLAFYQTGRRTSGSFESGIEFALRGILANPKFVFRAEADPPTVAPGAAYRLGDYELASRLSFFLWSSIPDDELLTLAEKGRLRAPAVLEQQVRRMLADPRSQALERDFAAQWLQLRNLRSAAPDKDEFPDWDDNLRQAFEQETQLFFESVVREDRNVVDLLSADYTFLNERLARHYRIPNVYGSHFRRVALPDDSRRGLLGHGSILTVTSHADRTAPVVRGKWILDNLLGTPPPPPPPTVPPLSEGEEAATLSMRERMEQHRKNPACASCHKIMDPIGLALENFDAVGAWRVRDGGKTIDTTGQLMDGTKVDGPVSLRQALLRRPEGFVGTLTAKLLTYALGRRLEYYDMPVVRRIVSDAARREYRFSSIVMGVVSSAPFQMRVKPSQEREGAATTVVARSRQ
jgi:hypothetical protein